MPTNTLNGNAINVESSKPGYAPKINRTPIAGTGRHQIHNLGEKNISFNLNCWVNNETDYDTIVALVSTSPLTFYDKFGDSFQVSIVKIAPTLKEHNHIKYNMVLEEVA